MVLDLNEMEKRLNLQQEFISRLMIEGKDYGVIPGTGDKPTLLLPGAHKLNSIYGLAPIVDILEAVEDFEGGFLKYTVKVQLLDKRNGVAVAEGVGSANTREKRYANAIRKGNATAADYANTCLKIAKKRALIDATLTATGTSGMFEQDLDDDPGHANQNHSSGRSNQGRKQAPNRQHKPDYNRPAAAVAAEPCTQPQVDEIWRLAEAAYPGEAKAVLSDWLRCPVEELGKQRASEIIGQLQDELERQRRVAEEAGEQEEPQGAPQGGAQSAASQSAASNYSGDIDDSDPFADE
jgi:hypothetical protein